jgi:hypothetical protein
VGGARDTTDAFDPPYELGGQVAVFVGALRGDVRPRTPGLPALAALAGLPGLPTQLGWKPVALLGGSLAVVVLCHYDDPPAERPARYSEAILALLVRRGARLATLPISMQLDRIEPTLDGRRHYSLPKQHEPTLRLSITRRGPVRALGDELRVEAAPRGGLSRKVLAPPCVLFKVGTRVLTALLPVLGTAEQPQRRAVVALRPRERGWPLKVTELRVPQARFRVFWAQAFDRCSTLLGAPSILDP